MGARYGRSMKHGRSSPMKGGHNAQQHVVEWIDFGIHHLWCY